jgi:HlyD family secretion protein
VRKTLKKYFALSVAVALLAGGLYFWLAAGNNGPRYRTLPVERGDLVQKVLATGTVNPVTLVQVGSQVSGTISNIYVDFNSKVERGLMVAQIDPALFEAQVAKARADYQSALADVEKGRAEVENTSRTLARMRAVRERDLVSQAEVDDAQMKSDTAKAELAAAQSKVGQTKASLDLAETNLRYTTIRSPVDGIVVDRTVDVGQTVAASFQAPVMFKIAADLAKMQVDTNVDEADIGRVVRGQEATFSVDAYSGEEFSGRVDQVRNAPQQVQNVVTYDVVIMVDNRDLKLKPGMTANVAIITARKNGVLKVANSALRFTPRPAEPGAAGARAAPPPTEEKGWQRVWVVDATGKLTAVPVQVGISDGVDSEVLAGKLAEGQQVVVEQIEEPAQAAASRRPSRPF